MTDHSPESRSERFRRKAVVIDAIKWNGGDYKCLDDFCGRNWTRADAVDMDYDDPEQVVVWNTASSQYLHVPVGQWIIRGVQGELYPCKADIFAATYEPEGALPSEIGRDTGDYKRGFEDGVRAYAWHKDGHQEVGTTGKTLKNALANVEKTWNYQP